VSAAAEAAIIIKLRAHLDNSSQGADAQNECAVVAIGRTALPVRHNAHFLLSTNLTALHAQRKQTKRNVPCEMQVLLTESARLRQMPSLHAQQIHRQTLHLNDALYLLHAVYVCPGVCPYLWLDLRTDSLANSSPQSQRVRENCCVDGKAESFSAVNNSSLLQVAIARPVLALCHAVVFFDSNVGPGVDVCEVKLRHLQGSLPKDVKNGAKAVKESACCVVQLKALTCHLLLRRHVFVHEDDKVLNHSHPQKTQIRDAKDVVICAAAPREQLVEKGVELDTQLKHRSLCVRTQHAKTAGHHHSDHVGQIWCGDVFEGRQVEPVVLDVWHVVLQNAMN